MNKQNKLIKCIYKYNQLEEQQNKIIRYLYDNTEIFEKKYMQDYPEELFRFFAGKITRFASEKNRILELLDNEQVEKLKEYEIMGGDY